MKKPERSWERLPEYVVTQDYSRCLSRVLASLPAGAARGAIDPLTLAAIQMAGGIVGCQADLPPEVALTAEDRYAFRERGLRGLRESRRRLERFRRRGVGDRAELDRALKLLDRVEVWLDTVPRVVGPMH